MPPLAFSFFAGLSAIKLLRLDKTVVALGKLGLQHIRVLGTELIETVALQGDGDALRIGVTCGRRVDKRELEADGAVEVVEEIAPAVKDRGLVLVLIELVVDVLKLYGLGVEALRHAADPVRVRYSLSLDRDYNTVAECTLTNRGYTLRERYTGEVIAIEERIFANVKSSFGYFIAIGGKTAGIAYQ